MSWKSQELQHLRTQIRTNHRRLFFAIIGSGLIFSSAVTLSVNAYAFPGLAATPVLSWLLAGIGIIFVYRAWPRRNS